MPFTSVLLIISLAIPGLVVVLLTLFIYEKYTVESYEDLLLQHPAHRGSAQVDFSTLARLPAPVQRYFKHVLTDGQPFISIVKTKQTGKLRTSKHSEKWYPFAARYLASPVAIGFVWSAKVRLFLRMHIRVLDCYISGMGINRAHFLSLFPLGSEINIPEINAGALHRYLAEAVWCPTALLPQSGIDWKPLSDNSAIATMKDGYTKVSLEFRFNDANEITSVYTPARYEKSKGGYQLAAWEGHFKHYILQDGVRVPTYGEVGWYENDRWECVWQAEVDNIKFNFQQPLAASDSFNESLNNSFNNSVGLSHQ